MTLDADASTSVLQLDTGQRQQIRAILDCVLPGVQVRVFGSRATGRARPFSDLDLLVMDPTRLSWDQQAALRDAFEASDLPFRVDVVERDGLAASLSARVLAEAVPL